MYRRREMGACCCSQFCRLRKVGEGSTAHVYHLFVSDHSTRFALKNFRNPEDCKREYEVLKGLRHENIVKCYGKPGSVGSTHFIVLEMIPKGSLQHLYEGKELEEPELQYLVWQLLHAVDYLHQQGIVHGDIKCANCLVGEANKLKLADFGRAIKLKGDRATRVDLNSVRWAAPEVGDGGGTYSKAAEIYSLGCTVLELVTRRVPFHEQSNWVVLCGKIPTVPSPPEISELARRFILRCLQKDPERRPTAAQLLEDEYVRNVGINSDPESSGALYVFDTSQTRVPSFLENNLDHGNIPTGGASHTPSCCMRRALNWRDTPGVQQSTRIKDELLTVQDVFGGSSPHHPLHNHRNPPCNPSCSFLNLYLIGEDDADEHVQNAGPEAGWEVQEAASDAR